MSSRSGIERRSRRSFCWDARPTIALRLGCAAVVLLLLVRSAAGQEAAEPTPTPLGPTHLVRPEGGPTVLVRPGLALSLVALRVSVPVRDGALPGAARTLAHLAAPRLKAEVAAVGGSARVARTPGHAVYTVVGPARSFDVLATAVRNAILAPPFTTAALVRARAAAEREVLSLLERPETRVRVLLRRRLYLEAAGLEGDAAGLDLLTLERLRHVWSEQYRPDRLRAVMVGSVPEPVLRSALGRWPAPGVPGSPAESVPPAARPEPQVLRPWAGMAYRVPGADPGALAVAAELVRHRVSASALVAGRAEAWWHPDGPALVVLGSVDTSNVAVAAARASAPELGPEPSGEALGASDLVLYLRRMVAEAAALLSDAHVATAARSLRSELLGAGRTAEGLADLLGAMQDATGDATAAEHLYRALDGVNTGAVREILRAMLEATPAFVEVVP